MKEAISISIGSSKRDKSVEIELLGQKVHLQRTGTDGDMKKAASMYEELDGKVDAFGVGGADLGLTVGSRRYHLYSVLSMVKNVHLTPIVDGTGLKMTLESQAAGVVENQIGDYLKVKRVFVVTAVDRWGLTQSFIKAGYETLFGDMMFALGLPFPLHTEQAVKRAAAILMNVAGRLPFKWVYPTGKEQEKRTPKWEEYFQWASVIAGDCHYIRRYMPEYLTGKVIVTNTTTPEDQDIFRKAGVKYLVTTTPVLEGRSFGTNMMEAAIIAAMGRKEPVDYVHPDSYFEEMERVIRQLKMSPQVQEL
jgi:hypothetical protein